MAPAVWRNRKKLSLRAVAKMLGISANSVRHYERGIREAPTSIALRYEKITGSDVTTEDLHAARRRFLDDPKSKAA